MVHQKPNINLINTHKLILATNLSFGSAFNLQYIFKLFRCNYSLSAISSNCFLNVSSDVRQLCQNKNQCNLTASDDTFRLPCVFNYTFNRYLEAKFTCAAGK